MAGLRPRCSAVDVDGAGRGLYEAATTTSSSIIPVELGRFWRGAFSAGGVAHEFVVAGALPDFDGERLLADSARICAAQIAFWHGTAQPPFERYLFLLNAVEDGHGGLEHRASTALIAPAPRPAAQGRRRGQERRARATATSTCSVSSATNISMPGTSSGLMPREFERYAYERENYTSLLWFFEGFTSYYDDLFLLRSGLIDEGRYLKLVSRTLTNVLATPGRLAQSVAQASFDAWVKYYRNDENTPNATISYYAKGALVALAFDLTLRAGGNGSLDDVLRRLWAQSSGGLIDENDIAGALEASGGRSFAGELAAWVHGTGELPLRPLLEAVAVDWQSAPATVAQRLGVRVAESALTGVKVTHVMRGGAAERAGLAAGDEILALRGWRIRRLDDAVRLLDGDAEAPLLVARDQRVLTLPLALPSAEASTAGAVALKPAAKPDADAQRALQGMARRLSDIRWVLPSPRRRVQFAALVLVVIAMHGCVTRTLAERMASFASVARMPPRIEVAYVRSLEPEAPPAVAPAPPPPPPPPRRAARVRAPRAASAPVVTAEAKAASAAENARIAE
jgi:predicted metalloprotease with PDZ domain